MYACSVPLRTVPETTNESPAAVATSESVFPGEPSQLSAEVGRGRERSGDPSQLSAVGAVVSDGSSAVNTRPSPPTDGG